MKLSSALRHASRIAHTEEGWILPLLDAIRDASYEEAVWSPAANVPGIWEVLAHAVPYAESLGADIAGEPHADEPDWPEVTHRTEAAWTAFKARAERAVERLQAVVEECSDEDLETPIPGGQTPRGQRIADIAIHDAYHAGQIVKLRQLYAAR